MKTCLRGRTFPACASALLLVAFGSGCNRKPDPWKGVVMESPKVSHPVVIGELTAPALPGWRQSIFQSNLAERVSYSLKDKGDELKIEIYWFKDRPVPQNAQKLKSEVQRYFTGRNSGLKSIGYMVKVISVQPTTFNGMTAVRARYTDSFSVYTSHGEHIRFINNNHYYLLSSEVSVSPKRLARFPGLQAKMDRAFAAVSKQLVPSSVQVTAKPAAR